jgi:indole-3-glycerol phosphate synthase
MATYLDKILTTTRADLALRREAASIAALESAAAAHTPRGFAHALSQRSASAPAVIAELKKASPSRGLIRPDFQIEPLAAALAAGGATALSVLTDEPYFQGSLANLRIASANASIPCLRKDFIVDEFQILEARANCADAILLIAAALSDSELASLNAAAHALGLDVLCEVHTDEELTRVLAMPTAPNAIGVNNRDLRSFAVSLDTSLALVQRIPFAVVRVAESGIHTATDIQLLRLAGFDAFLVGESLMRQPDPGAALRTLLTPAVEEDHRPGYQDGWAKGGCA